jgi:hypothetical protein
MYSETVLLLELDLVIYPRFILYVYLSLLYRVYGER